MEIQKQYSVVVVGEMNPAIHHPSWYEMAGFLTPEESAGALSGDVLVTPQVSKFVVGTLEVQCIGNQWICQTSSALELDRILSTARRVFERLSETPVTAFGMNYSVTKIVDSQAYSGLCASLRKTPFAVPVEGEGGSVESVALTYPLVPLSLPSGEVLERRFRVATALRSAFVMQVAINIHHDIRLSEMRKFELSPMLHVAEPVYALAESHAAQVFLQAQGAA